ncbi:WD40-repeat-containing domain protein [Cladochytrium replicatum]|nr:WD40-repeat-containing domain protein [Cladochytrium replicatum]
MANSDGRVHLRTCFEKDLTIESIYTGGRLAVSRDGSLLAAPVEDVLNVMDLNDGRTIWKSEGESGAITCVSVRPDGKNIVCATRALLIMTYDRSGTLLRSWKAHEAPVLAMDFDSTSTLLATGSADGSVRVWDIDGGFCTHVFRGHGGIVASVRFFKMKNGRLCLATGADDGRVRVFDLIDAKCVAVLEGHNSVVRAIDVLDGGARLVSGGRDSILMVWNLETKHSEKTVPVFETVEAMGIVPGTDQEPLVYTGGDKGLLRVWNLRTGNCVHQKQMSAKNKHTIFDMILLPESRTLCVVMSDQNIMFCNLDDYSIRKQIAGYNEEVIDLKLLGEDENCLAVATNSEQIRVYNLTTMDCTILSAHSDVVICIDRSRDGTILVSGSKDNQALVWNVDISQEDAEKRILPIGMCLGHTEAISSLCMSKKGRDFFVTASQDRTVKCWDLKELTAPKKSLVKPGESLNELTKVRSLYTFQAHEKDINTVTVSPNDKVIATGSQDKTAKVWSAADGSLIGTCQGHRRGVWCVEFSPVDQVLATSSGDKTIKLWSLSDYSCLKTFEGHLNSVLKVGFLSAGMQLVSAGSDGLVKVWTIRTNLCDTTLDNHEDKVWALAVRRDHTGLVSGSADSTITIWKDTTLQVEQQKTKENEEKILKEQDLSNSLVKGDYARAVRIALELGKPFQLLNVLSDIYKKQGQGTMENVIARINKKEVAKLLSFIRDWNTTAKFSHIAQSTLNVILRSWTKEEILALPQIKDLLQALIPYTEKHFAHSDQLLTRSYLLEFTLDKMDKFARLDEDGKEEMEF